MGDRTTWSASIPSPSRSRRRARRWCSPGRRASTSCPSPIPPSSPSRAGRARGSPLLPGGPPPLLRADSRARFPPAGEGRPLLPQNDQPPAREPMGRIFEVRKHTMFARWDRMSKQFARIGKEITIAVKAAGPDPHANPLLRRVIQNARAINMPKDKIETAIKRASGKDAESFHEITYEGYAPHGVALMIETATDNPTRTVSNMRTHFNKGGGSLANSGSVGFQFKQMGVFRLKPEGVD